MYKNLEKYLSFKRSVFDSYKSEILHLDSRGANQKAILQFLKDKGVKATQSNLSKWLSRQKSNDGLASKKILEKKKILH